MRVGVVTKAEAFPEARRPAYKLEIDFGPELGVKRSSAQITRHYRPEDLQGRHVIAVVNFPPKRIGPVVSEVLVLGAYDAQGDVILLAPDRPVPCAATGTSPPRCRPARRAVAADAAQREAGSSIQCSGRESHQAPRVLFGAQRAQ